MSDASEGNLEQPQQTDCQRLIREGLVGPRTTCCKHCHAGPGRLVRVLTLRDGRRVTVCCLVRHELLARNSVSYR